jgi:hypothetical protein
MTIKTTVKRIEYKEISSLSRLAQIEQRLYTSNLSFSSRYPPSSRKTYQKEKTLDAINLLLGKPMNRHFLPVRSIMVMKNANMT